MTPRQRGIAAKVQAHRDNLIAHARDLPIGYCVHVSLPAQFVPFSASRPLRVVLMREPEAVRYREDAPLRFGRKGYQEPRWRTLGRLDGAAHG